jgi:hypothetical protein
MAFPQSTDLLGASSSHEALQLSLTSNILASPYPPCHHTSHQVSDIALNPLEVLLII